MSWAVSANKDDHTLFFPRHAYKGKMFISQSINTSFANAWITIYIESIIFCVYLTIKNIIYINKGIDNFSFSI